MSVTPAPPTSTDPHKTETSTGVADVATIEPPPYASGMFITVKTTAARIVFDGSTPDPVTKNGLVIPAGVLPAAFPFASAIDFCSDVAGNCELDVLYVT